MSFLTAEWRKLCFANYAVDPKVLQPYLPAHCELDFFEGKCYVSFVGFLFDNVKLKGISIPFHTRFEEVNLRFYVKYRDNGVWKRGTVFISEIVSKPAIALIANTFYNEKYSLCAMDYKHALGETENTFSYELKIGKKWQIFSVTTAKELKPFAPGSATEFITEHYWGYSLKSKLQSIEYEVRHPKWEAYEVKNYKIDIDFGAIYGAAFSDFTHKKPDSVMCMEGSPISIEGKILLTK